MNLHYIFEQISSIKVGILCRIFRIPEVNYTKYLVVQLDEDCMVLLYSQVMTLQYGTQCHLTIDIPMIHPKVEDHIIMILQEC